MRMKDSVLELVKLGKIPNDSEMSNEEFKRYDKLLQMEEVLKYRNRVPLHKY